MQRRDTSSPLSTLCGAVACRSCQTLATAYMLRYYEQRQEEYETIYVKPERQNDLAWLETELLKAVKERDVLEIACGTGYWTRRMAESARSVYATDVSAQLAARALASCHVANVTSGTLDAYAIPESSEYDCVVAGFFYSHVPVNEQQRFFSSIAEATKPGSWIILFDNRYVEGGSTPISRRAATGDTFQVRHLSDDSSYEVLKNFPSSAELSAVLNQYFGNVAIHETQYFWFASGVVGG